MSRTVVMFSGKAGVGKTTSAKFLCGNLGWDKCILVPLASNLKTIAEEAFGWDGTKDELGRGLLIGLAKVARDYDLDFWVKKLYNYSSKFNWQYLVIDDWRYPNELEYLEDKYGYENVLTVRVERPNGEVLKGTKAYNDPSETSLPSANTAPTFYDQLIHNTGTLEDLQHKIENLFAVRKV
jgi:hypothetical protein